MPRSLIVGVAAVTTAPALLGWIGVDLGSAPAPANHDLESAYQAMGGSFTHSLLEWTAFCTALFAAGLAMIHFSLTRSVVTPVIALALLAAGTMDAFHTLAASRLIDAVADNSSLIPFTWALCRMFGALVLSLGVGLVLWRRPTESGRGVGVVVSASIAFGVAAYVLIQLAATSAELPQTMFPGALITRPYDVMPLVLYLVLAALAYRLHSVEPTLFSAALLVSAIPQIATQLHMAFGSGALFDHHFNAAHFLKIVAYATPLIGLALDYVRTYQEAARAASRLEGVKAHLQKALKTSERQKWDLFWAKGQAEDMATKAEKADHAKSAFLATMSHELRTPMNAVIGMTSVLESTPLTDEQDDCVSTIRSSGSALLGIINDILDFSKIEAGRIELESEPFEMDACLNAVKNLLALSASKKTLELSWSRASDVPAWVHGDAARVQQILVNLGSNALKFTEKGSILIAVDASLSTADRHELHFAVRDTGVGIPADRLNRLFQPFTQADASITRKYGGTGLGLTISKRFSEMMGGRMWVESEAGEGSTFHFTILADPAEAPAGDPSSNATAEAGAAPSDLRILIAEDNSINQKVAVKILEKLGYRADVAGNGLKALEALERQPYDVILMDMQMPEMDGLEASRQIRAQYPPELRPRIIALTANAMKEDRDQCIEAGMDDFLAKPFTSHMIAEMLAQCPRKESGRPEPADDSGSIQDASS